MLFKFQLETESPTSERCHIIKMCNSKVDETCSIAHARVEPSDTTQLHALKNTTERYVILEDQGSVEVDGGKPQPVGPMDEVFIPAGASQRITNTGVDDLLFLVVCAPRFNLEIYINLEEHD